MCVQLPAETALAVLAMGSDEVNVCLLRIGLRNETSNESDHLASMLNRKTRRTKMSEEDPRQQVRHISAVPPLTNHTDDRVVIAFFKLSDSNRGGRRDSVSVYDPAPLYLDVAGSGISPGNCTARLSSISQQLSLK